MSNEIFVEYNGKRYKVKDSYISSLLLNSIASSDLMERVFRKCSEMEDENCIFFINSLTLEDVLEKYPMKSNCKNIYLEGKGLNRFLHYDILNDDNTTKHCSICLYNLFS